MNELLGSADGWPSILAALLASGAGAGLGVIFFGGLWWTVRRAAVSPRPAAWIFGSLVLRMAVALSGFHAVAGGRWERLLACLLGFVVARTLVARWTRTAATETGQATREAGHAS